MGAAFVGAGDGRTTRRDNFFLRALDLPLRDGEIFVVVRAGALNVPNAPRTAIAASTARVDLGSRALVSLILVNLLGLVLILSIGAESLRGT